MTLTTIKTDRPTDRHTHRERKKEKTSTIKTKTKIKQQQQLQQQKQTCQSTMPISVSVCLCSFFKIRFLFFGLFFGKGLPLLPAPPCTNQTSVRAHQNPREILSKILNYNSSPRSGYPTQARKRTTVVVRPASIHLLVCSCHMVRMCLCFSS